MPNINRQIIADTSLRTDSLTLFPLDSSLNAVSVIVSRSHIALVKQNPQWPIPRYTGLPQHPKGPAFVRLARHKITDVTSLVCVTICFADRVKYKFPFAVSYGDFRVEKNVSDYKWRIRTGKKCD